MGAYASPLDLAKWMPGFEAGFTDAEMERALLLLDIATGLIDDELGQHLELATTTDQWDSGTGTDKLVLSRWPVTAVPSVTVDGVALVVDTDYEWELAGILTRKHGVWACEEDITAVYPAGYASIPTSVKGLCLEMTAAAWTSPAGKRSVRIGDYAVTAAERGGLALTTRDKKFLGRYSANR